MDTNNKWIYESPDRGETIYQRRFGSLKREQISTPSKSSYYSDHMWMYHSKWDTLANQHPCIKEQLENLLITVALIK